MRVVILGGGAGGIATAWHLAHRPDEIESITVYEQSWRLGGKGASGRSAKPEYRIQEHGLHILMGCYEHTLHMLKQAYDRLAPTPDAPSVLPWEHALRHWDEVSLNDPRSSHPWKIRMPHTDASIGEPPELASHRKMLEKALEWLRELRRRLYVSVEGTPPAVSFDPDLLNTEEGRLVLLASLRRVQAEDWAAIESKIARDQVRRLWIGVWLISTNVIGILSDGLITNSPDLTLDFSKINGSDYRDWLRGHGSVPRLPEDLGWKSPPVVALYDLAFAYEREFAAGVALHGAFQVLLGYRAHLAYLMNGGMGDIVFAPLYLALRSYTPVKVDFKFFHRLLAISPRKAASAIDAIELVKIESDAAGYDPLVTVTCDTTLAWPTVRNGVSSPVNEKAPLVAGKHFDVAVLAIPAPTLESELAGLMAASERFKEMVLGTKSIATQALQLWLEADLETLGWKHGPAMLISHTPRPFNSWVDMTHMGRRECWSSSPKTIAYFCDSLPDEHENPQLQVEKHAQGFLADGLRKLWPHFKPDHQLCPLYARANFAGSDRYMLSLPSTIQSRLPAAASGFHNLALAGDWTHTEWNAGCFDAAVQAGKAAAQAILDGDVHG